MIQIKETIISDYIIKVKFCCNLNKCKGLCCVEGDAGAPLTNEEIEIIQDNFSIIKKYLPKASLRIIKKSGFYYIDKDGEYLTQLVNNKECVFVVFENGIARCTIEKAYSEGKINFQKPISCHLYPARIKKYNDYEFMNYDYWNICVPAIENGDKKGLPLYCFLSDALIRKYGSEWYNELLEIAKKYF